jgi:putative endonuclease
LAEAAQPWFCYLVRCRDGSLYVGIAADVEERVKEHNWGMAARFTAKRRPVTLAWFEMFDSQEAARRREVTIKKWSRTKKLQLITGWQKQVVPSVEKLRVMAAKA